MTRGVLMKNKATTSRRTFLKTTAAGTTGLMVGGLIKNVKAYKGAWYKGKQKNKEIDNLRVVCCYDPIMVTGTLGSSFSSQNSALDTDRIHSDMDLMAKYLAQKNDPTEAWSTIFQKPSNKEWNEVKVAFKVNAVYSRIMPHIAIIDKVCQVLNSFGVSYSNMIIFDGDGNAAGSSKYTPYTDGNGLPSGVIVSDRDDALGGTTTITVSGSSYKCVKDIADGTIDILINCGVNKGHGSTYGSCTLCMKNHIGTVKYSCPSSVTDLTDINRCDPIMGGDPPREQLCIMDSILAARSGPSSSPTNPPPYRIAMGTFGPAVDFLTVRKIREELNGWSHPESTVNKFLSNFDYTDQEIQDLVDLSPEENNGKGWLEFDPSQTGLIPNKSKSSRVHIFTFSVTGTPFKQITRKITLSSYSIKNASIVDMKGRLIRTLSLPADGRKKIIWDGRNERGRLVRSGKYILNIHSGKSKKSTSFTLQK